MKKTGVLLLALAMVCFCASALGELGFAEIKKDNVNVRESAGGKTLWQLDSPQSVYVFEEKTVGKYLWCHVSTYIGKNPKTGWIRGDMLRFLSEEFSDIVDIDMGYSYIVGLRKDGTVAIMGDDMPHAPCINEVRTWKNMTQVITSTCNVYALNANDKVRGVGKDDHFDGIRAASISGDSPFPLNKDGYFLADEWNSAWDRHVDTADDLGKERYCKILGDSTVYAALTCSGEVRCFNDHAPDEQYFAGKRYVDLDVDYSHIVAVREDRRVDVEELTRYTGGFCGQCSAVEEWENVIRVSTLDDDILGLRADGKVYYAGKNQHIAKRVAEWENVVDIAMGQDCCAALLKDGTVVMAGNFHEGYFR